MRLGYRIGWVVIVACAGLGCEVLQDKREIRCECTTSDGAAAFCAMESSAEDTKLDAP